MRRILMCENRKVVLLTTHLERGGTLVFAGVVAEQLKARGFQPLLASLYRGRPSLVDREMEARAVVLAQAENSRFGYIRILWRLRKLLMDERPDSVMGVQPAASAIGALCGLAARVSRRVNGIHASPSVTRFPLRPLDAWFRKIGVYTDVVCVSHSLARELTREKVKFHVVPNGVKASPSSAPRQAVRRMHGLAEEARWLCMLGRLSEEKNVVNAVMAACSRPELNLVIAGDGPLRSHLERLISASGALERVRLLGNMTHTDALDLLLACDGFVQPSRHEGRSIALLEALISGVPSLVSDITQQREVITLENEERAALLCPIDDIEKMADAMTILAFDDDVREGLRARSLKLSASFDVERMGDAYARILSKSSE